jgi:septal ring factor EnvC (AmiA/AmiB activator)
MNIEQKNTIFNGDFRRNYENTNNNKTIIDESIHFNYIFNDNSNCVHMTFSDVHMTCDEPDEEAKKQIENEIKLKDQLEIRDENKELKKQLEIKDNENEKLKKQLEIKVNENEKLKNQLEIKDNEIYGLKINVNCALNLIPKSNIY